MQISSMASYVTPAAPKSGGAPNANALSPATKDDPAKAVEQEFLKFAKMSPFERLRANILNDMGLKEEDLQSLSPAQRAAVEQKIKQLIEQQLHKNPTQTGQLIDAVA